METREFNDVFRKSRQMALVKLEGAIVNVDEPKRVEPAAEVAEKAEKVGTAEAEDPYDVIVN